MLSQSTHTAVSSSCQGGEPFQTDTFDFCFACVYITDAFNWVVVHVVRLCTFVFFEFWRNVVRCFTLEAFKIEQDLANFASAAIEAICQKKA